MLLRRTRYACVFLVPRFLLSPLPPLFFSCLLFSSSPVCTCHECPRRFSHPPVSLGNLRRHTGRLYIRYLFVLGFSSLHFFEYIPQATAIAFLFYIRSNLPSPGAIPAGKHHHQWGQHSALCGEYRMPRTKSSVACVIPNERRSRMGIGQSRLPCCRLLEMVARRDWRAWCRSMTRRKRRRRQK